MYTEEAGINFDPRFEDPEKIIDAIMSGMKHPEKAIRETDRRKAIEKAVLESNENDIVLIAGKGHEKTQSVGRMALPFDDVIVARESLNRELV